MTSGQEMERVYSYNPEPARGSGYKRSKVKVTGLENRWVWVAEYEYLSGSLYATCGARTTQRKATSQYNTVQVTVMFSECITTMSTSSRTLDT